MFDTYHGSLEGGCAVCPFHQTHIGHRVHTPSCLPRTHNRLVSTQTSHTTAVRGDGTTRMLCKRVHTSRTSTCRGHKILTTINLSRAASIMTYIMHVLLPSFLSSTDRIVLLSTQASHTCTCLQYEGTVRLVRHRTRFTIENPKGRSCPSLPPTCRCSQSKPTGDRWNPNRPCSRTCRTRRTHSSR